MDRTDRPEADDVTGHGRRAAPAEPTEDVTGHMPFRRSADAETDEDDDTEGHMPYRRSADAEREEADDVSGHMPFRRTADAEADDVEGHMPRIRGNVHARTEAERTSAVDAHGTHPSDDVTGHMPRIRGGSRGHDGGWPAEGSSPR